MYILISIYITYILCMRYRHCDVRVIPINPARIRPNLYI